jgi:hypothetical protein
MCCFCTTVVGGLLEIGGYIGICVDLGRVSIVKAG